MDKIYSIGGNSMEVVIDWRFILVGMPGNYEPCGRGRIILNIFKQNGLTEACKIVLGECLDMAICDLFGNNIILMGLAINLIEKAPKFDVVPKIRVFRTLVSMEDWSAVSGLMSQALREFYPNQIGKLEQSYVQAKNQQQIPASQSAA